ncbi:hypothetical protein RB653_000083 [Dictyostelium firmibasis]|uniref:Nucleolar GTP-binding protein 1 Rossman-fold domain-containing protein n=1 Tax=Dictyostelium firmibasis TaxID=79012 RepID=A0AAN7Z0X2_9MYCE
MDIIQSLNNLKTPTLLLIGYPNVGKSTLMNNLTLANIEVEKFATKFLFVGQINFKGKTLRVIDTQSILDHQLDEIEIQSINTLTQLNSCILFLIDISENCGHTIKQQTDLLFSIKKLFLNKPLLVILNKIDLKTPNDVPIDDWILIESLEDFEEDSNGDFSDSGTQLIPMSNLIENSIENLKEIVFSTFKERKKENLCDEIKDKLLIF